MESLLLLNVLKKEIEKSTGCTDPGAVCLTVAKAVETLGCIPDRVDVVVSPNIYKNGISVGVPGTGKRGLYHAAALGIYLSDHVSIGLALLEYVNEEMVRQAQAFINKGGINSDIVEAGKNGIPLSSSTIRKKEESVDELLKYPVAEIIDTIKGIELDNLAFLIDAAMINRTTALAGFKSNETRLARHLYPLDEGKVFPYSAAALGKFYTAAAAEARMIGLVLPIMSIAGSGNHGITNFLGVLAVGETLHVNRVQLARALAISSAITVYIKGYIKRMTAFCGCSVAAATGVAAAAVYLIGGSYQDMVNAMNTVIGALAGIVCDGAKESCAYKLSVATAAAIEYAYLSTEKKVYLSKGLGIISNNIEDTFRKLGELNNPGMVETDKCILNIIEDIQKNNNKGDRGELEDERTNGGRIIY